MDQFADLELSIMIGARYPLRLEGVFYCKFHYSILLFKIFMKSPENGTAELKARHPLDCESKEKYELSIAAVACNGLISPR